MEGRGGEEAQRVVDPKKINIQKALPISHRHINGYELKSM
jgi:hypothetical protein